MKTLEKLTNDSFENLNWTDEIKNEITSTNENSFTKIVEFFNMEKTKKSKIKYFPISALDNYILKSNKGKKIATCKKNLKANNIKDYESGKTIIDNTKKFLSFFYRSYTPNLNIDPKLFEFKINPEIHKSMFFIFTDLDSISNSNLKLKEYFKNLINIISTDKKKKILKIVNNYMFYFNLNSISNDNTIFCSEQQTVLWLDGKYYTLTK